MLLPLLLKVALNTIPRTPKQENDPIKIHDRYGSASAFRKNTDGYHSTRTHFPDSEPTNLCSLSLVHVLIGDAIHINFIV